MKWQPSSKRSHWRSARALAIGRAVVVDQAGLHNCISYGSVIAAREHMVIAEEILPAAIVLNHRAKRAAAAVRDRVALRIKIVVVSAGCSQLNGGRQFCLVAHRITDNSCRIEEDCGLGF